MFTYQIPHNNPSLKLPRSSSAWRSRSFSKDHISVPPTKTDNGCSSNPIEESHRGSFGALCSLRKKPCLVAKTKVYTSVRMPRVVLPRPDMHLNPQVPRPVTITTLSCTRQKCSGRCSRMSGSPLNRTAVTCSGTP